MNDFADTLYNPQTGEQVTFIQRAEDTGGKRTIVEILVAPNAKGPPLHYHTSITETFEILEGEVMLRVGKDTMRMTEGQRFTVGLNQLHTFWSEVDRPARIRGTVEPANIDLENSFRISFGLARDGFFSRKGTPKHLSHMAILTTMSQSNLGGAFSIFTSVFKLLARTRRCREMQQALIRQYCQRGVTPKVNEGNNTVR